MIKLYFDQHVRRAITTGLRIRDVDVLTAFEDDMHEAPDSLLLDRASELGRVLFSQDDDLLKEAAHRQTTAQFFAGLIYAHQLGIGVGQCVEELELLSKLSEPNALENSVVFLPL